MNCAAGDFDPRNPSVAKSARADPTHFQWLTEATALRRWSARGLTTALRMLAVSMLVCRCASAEPADRVVKVTLNGVRVALSGRQLQVPGEHLHHGG